MSSLPTTIFPGSVYPINIPLGSYISGNVTVGVLINSTVTYALSISCYAPNKAFTYSKIIKNATSYYSCETNYPLLVTTPSLTLKLYTNPMFPAGMYTLNIIISANNNLPVKTSHETKNVVHTSQNSNPVVWATATNALNTTGTANSDNYRANITSIPGKLQASNKVWVPPTFESKRSPSNNFIYSCCIPITILLLISIVILYYKYIHFRRRTRI